MIRRSLLVAAVGFLAFTAAALVVAQEDVTLARPGRNVKERAREQRTRLQLHALEVQAAASAKAAKPKIVKVDCSKKKTIAAALADTADTLIIEVSGVCQENFQVRRSDVTFRGSDPTLDGIQGVVADPQPTAAVELHYAQNIRFENLKIEKSPSNGLGAWDSWVEFANCRFLDNTGAGLHTSESSATAAADKVTFARNYIGLRVQRNATFACTGCSFENNTSQGVYLPLYGNFGCDQCTFMGNAGDAMYAFGGSYGEIYNSPTVMGTYGVAADLGSEVSVVDSTITAPSDGSAVYSANSGIVDVRGGVIAGPIYAFQNGQVSLVGVTQAPGFGNVISWNSFLRAGPRGLTITTLGGTFFDGFGKGLLEDLTHVTGNIDCSGGGDASAGNVTIDGTVTSCEHLSKP